MNKLKEFPCGRSCYPDFAIIAASLMPANAGPMPINGVSAGETDLTLVRDGCGRGLRYSNRRQACVPIPYGPGPGYDPGAAAAAAIILGALQARSSAAAAAADIAAATTTAAAEIATSTTTRSAWAAVAAAWVAAAVWKSRAGIWRAPSRIGRSPAPASGKY